LAAWQFAAKHIPDAFPSTLFIFFTRLEYIVQIRFALARYPMSVDINSHGDRVMTQQSVNVSLLILVLPAQMRGKM